MFVERNAKLIALIVTLIVIFTGITNRYLKSMHLKKKYKTDDNYDMNLVASNLKDIEKIILKVINQMHDENLLADETMVIFQYFYE